MSDMITCNCSFMLPVPCEWEQQQAKHY